MKLACEPDVSRAPRCQRFGRTGGASKSARPGLAAWLALVVATAMIITGAGPAPAVAQGLGQGFGGFAANRDAPIQIDADGLEVNDAKQQAVFTGNVVAVQDTFRLSTPRLEVKYRGDAAGAATGGGAQNGGGADSQISRIRATGGVVVRNGTNANAVSQWADFDVQAGVITLGDDVTLTQEGNVLKGERLMIDLNSGTSRFQTSKRIRAIFKRNDTKKSNTNAN